MVAQLSPAQREQLTSWFEKYGANETVEVEVRVKDVTAYTYKQVESKLHSAKHWVDNTPRKSRNLDIIHASRVRETKKSADDPDPVFLRKVQHESFEVEASSGHRVRFALSTEDKVHFDQSPVSVVRSKDRTTFNHKNLFVYELTEVKQGPSEAALQQAETDYEIEIEYCGQKIFKAEPGYFSYLVDSLMGKVNDVVKVVAAGKERAASNIGGLYGGVVVLKSTMDCKLKLICPTNGDVLEAEKARQAKWVVAGPPEGEYILVANLPCTVDNIIYPLYHFLGHVSRAAVEGKGKQ